jgi:hypothetical protein
MAEILEQQSLLQPQLQRPVMAHSFIANDYESAAII